MRERHPLADFGFAPGGYACTCSEPDCATVEGIWPPGQFVGAKRSFRCEPCARKAAAAYVPPPPPPPPPPEPVTIPPDVLAACRRAYAVVREAQRDDASNYFRVPRKTLDRLRGALSVLPADIAALLETSPMTDRPERIMLSVDGNEGCAMLGSNIQDGECDFAPVVKRRDEHIDHAEIRACYLAHSILCNRLGHDLPYAWLCGKPGAAGG